MKLKLSDLSSGQRAKIEAFEEDEIVLKLMEMGCLPGEIISVEKIAPLGDPIHFQKDSRGHLRRRRYTS